MLNSRKIASAVAAAFLGGFVLFGSGAAQAVADDGAGACVDDGDTIRCVQSQTCSGGGAVECGNAIVITVKEAES
ncbi:hypothetical protein KYY02_05435 [Streptomyces pimonensis]|uniref:Uncharacterized protein n=1 Tax=Streptomyces pimonensis TaxID=2860288 RepID=A0ABV4IU77_9ACTN